jgi:hypothetical protein
MSEIREKFDRCVKKVKVKLGESGGIAVCTKSVLWKRGLTLKQYKKGKLIIQSHIARIL